MTPLEALNRVVYLMDRSLAPSPTRSTPSATRPTWSASCPRASSRRRAAAGTLTELPGIGKSTGRGHHRGRSPARCPTASSTSRPSTVVPLGEAGRPYREALKGDCHTHSHLVRRRRPDRADGPHRHGARPRLPGAHRPLAPAHRRPRAQPPSACASSSTRSPCSTSELAPFRILTGIEVDILEDGALDQDDDLLARLDVVVASVHSKLRMDRAGHDPAHGRWPWPAPTSTSSATAPAASCARRWPRSAPTPRWCGPSRSSTPRSCSPPAPASTPRSRSTAAPSARTRPTTCSSWPSSGSARSRSTPTPTPRASSSGRAYGCDKAARHEIDLDRIVNTWAADDLVVGLAPRRLSRTDPIRRLRSRPSARRRSMIAVTLVVLVPPVSNATRTPRCRPRRQRRGRYVMPRSATASAAPLPALPLDQLALLKSLGSRR